MYVGFEVIPEEVAVTHGPTGVELGGSLRQGDAAFASWHIEKAPSTSLTSALNLSTRSSDIDLKDFLVKRGVDKIIQYTCSGLADYNSNYFSLQGGTRFKACIRQRPRVTVLALCRS